MSNGNWQVWNQIEQHAAQNPARLAYGDLESGRSITYRELVDAVIAAPIDRTYASVVSDPDAIQFVIRMIATLRAGRAAYLMPCDAGQAELARAGLIAATLESDGGDGEVILSSSGTTGLPKAVRRSRSSLDAVARAMVNAIGITSDDRVIAAVPLAHSYGLEHGLLAPLFAGSTTHICRGLNLQQIERALIDGATIFPAVPSMIELLASANVAASHCLRSVYSAGGLLPDEIAERFHQQWNVPVGQVYGLTEVGSVFYRDPLRDIAGSVGRAVEGVSARIAYVDAEGEVVIRANSMLSGYVGESVDLIQGHFRTGDLGKLTPAGELILTGRLRLLIDVGGAKVNPLEVEAVLAQHPGVAASVVLPLKLSVTIQKTRAIIIPKDFNNPPAADELRQFVRAQLAPYKVPRVIEFRERFPRSSTGKILRHQLECE